MPFDNTNRYTCEKLKGDRHHVAANLTHYIKGFSTRPRRPNREPQPEENAE